VSVNGFWAIAGGLAQCLVPEEHVARTTALTFGGVSAATVLRVPLETMTGEIGGRRSAFAAGGFAVARPPRPDARHQCRRPTTGAHPAHLKLDEPLRRPPPIVGIEPSITHPLSGDHHAR
jgi:hypothetical protein